MTTQQSFILLFSDVCTKFVFLLRVPTGETQMKKQSIAVESFLQNLDEGQVDKLCLEDMFIFVMGADAVPPFGFDHKISV